MIFSTVWKSVYIVSDTMLSQRCVTEELLHQNLSWLVAFLLLTEMGSLCIISVCHAQCDFRQSQHCNKFAAYEDTKLVK